MDKMQIIDEILDFLQNSQGSELKKALMAHEMKEKPGMEASESPAMQAMEDSMGTEMHGKPGGIAVEKLSVMSKPKGDMMDQVAMDDSGMGAPANAGAEDEMSDDELKELLGKLV